MGVVGSRDGAALDQYEYLGALQVRDDLETWLNMNGHPAVADSVDEIDSRFEDLTSHDLRFAEHFAAQAGSGWWWSRMPRDSDARQYIVQDWG